MCICPINVNKSKQQIIIAFRELFAHKESKAEKSERSKWHEITVKWKLCDVGGAWVIVIYTHLAFFLYCSSYFFVFEIKMVIFFSLPVWFDFRAIYHFYSFVHFGVFCGREIEKFKLAMLKRYKYSFHMCSWSLKVGVFEIGCKQIVCAHIKWLLHAWIVGRQQKAVKQWGWKVEKRILFTIYIKNIEN